MRKSNLILLTLGLAFLFNACKLDNYDAPNGQLVGQIIDIETNELIQQDIIRGTTIKLIEHGYDPVTPQYLRVKTDGTYANTLLFANTYTVQPDQRNFVQIDEQEVVISANSKLDFKVQPYIRVKDATIVKNGDKVTATFHIDQTVSENVRKIGLYAHTEPIVGEPIRLFASELNLNRAVDESEVMTLEINVKENSSVFKSGQQYFFKIGAVINIPEAKFNYAPAVRLAVD
ncbi:DUF3823 domain-containing protein [Sphingobacterium sp. HJSM2_6]|uniref:DUF3823 domain-containing protein n=1 Tax=Sphingobacterium sp. HJSM2_6 TaxID=3366264 RepID=UPI003BE4C0A8